METLLAYRYHVMFPSLQISLTEISVIIWLHSFIWKWRVQILYETWRLHFFVQKRAYIFWKTLKWFDHGKYFAPYTRYRAPWCNTCLYMLLWLEWRSSKTPFFHASKIRTFFMIIWPQLFFKIWGPYLSQKVEYPFFWKSYKVIWSSDINFQEMRRT